MIGRPLPNYGSRPTGMCDRMWVGKPSRYVTGHPDQLSLGIPPWVCAMGSKLRASR